jgi:hemerythrin
LVNLEDVLHGSSLQEARHDISELKEKVIEHAEVNFKGENNFLAE